MLQHQANEYYETDAGTRVGHRDVEQCDDGTDLTWCLLFEVPQTVESHEQGRLLNWKMTRYWGGGVRILPMYARQHSGDYLRMPNGDRITVALGYMVPEVQHLNITHCKYLVKLIHLFPQFATEFTAETLAACEDKIAQFSPPAKRSRSPSVRQVLQQFIKRLPNEPALEDELKRIFVQEGLMVGPAQK